MKRRPVATVHAIELPGVSTGAIRVEVLCDGSTTGITFVPSAVALDMPALTAFTIFEHRQRCPANCDLTAAYAASSPELRAYIDRLDAASQAGLIRRYIEGRRS